MKEKQILKYTDPSNLNYVNPNNKQVIFFIKDTVPNVPVEAKKLQAIKDSGAMVINDMDALKEILKNGQ